MQRWIKGLQISLIMSVLFSADYVVAGPEPAGPVSVVRSSEEPAQSAAESQKNREATTTEQDHKDKKDSHSVQAGKKEESPDGQEAPDGLIEVRAAVPYLIEEQNIVFAVETIHFVAPEFASSLGEQVAGQRALRIVRQGAALDRQNLRIRGLGGSRLRLELDGIPLNDPSGYPIDLAGIDSGIIHEATLSSGPQSGTLGTGAIGGVLALSSQSDAQGFAAAAHSEAGSFGYLSQRGQVRWGTEQNQLQLSIYQAMSEGDFHYKTITYSADNALIGPIKRRENNDRLRQQLSLKYQHHDGAWTSGSLLMWQNSQGGVAGLSGHETALSREENSSLMLAANAQYYFSRGLFSLKSMLREKNSWSLLQGILGLYENREVMRSLWAQLGFKYLNLAGLFDLAVELEQELFLNAQGANSLSRNQSRWAQALALRMDKSIRKNLALSLHLRWDALRDGIAEANVAQKMDLNHILLQPGGAANLSWAILPVLALDAGVGRSFRAASFFEKYGAPGAYFTSNEKLRPETGLQVDTALRWRQRNNQVKASIFAARMDETIIFLNRNAYDLRPENTGALWRTGVELSAQLHFGPGFSQHYIAEYLWTRLDISGQALPNTPALRFLSRTSWQHRVLTSQLMAKTYFEAQARGASSGNLFGELALAPQASVNMGVALSLRKSSFISCQLLNILDAQSRMDMRQVPLPGRSWRCSLQLGL